MANKAEKAALAAAGTNQPTGTSTGPTAGGTVPTTTSAPATIGTAPMMPPAATENPTVNTGPKADKVEIDRATLNTILDTIETLKASDAKKNETIERLEAVADKGRLSHYDTEKSKDGVLIQRAKVGFYDGFPIIAWSKAKDEVGFRNGQLVVSQLINLFLDKGAEQPELVADVEYLYWAQNTTTEEGEVVSKTQTAGNDYWTIEMKDGRKLTLDIRFINPF